MLTIGTTEKNVSVRFFLYNWYKNATFESSSAVETQKPQPHCNIYTVSFHLLRMKHTAGSHPYRTVLLFVFV